MAATVVSLSLPQQPHSVLDNPAEARKRRREILASQRSSTATPDVTSSDPHVVVTENPCKKQKVAAALPAVVSPTTPAKKAIGSTTTKSGGGKPKKPQMKYDPDVPMTKEEAAVWRREQRRKRNRESAAASRQRQRDRIVELEAEVEEWKAKFDQAMEKIRQLEENATGATSALQEVTTESQGNSDAFADEASGEAIDIHSPEALVEEVFKETTILISPSQSPRSVSPNTTSSFDYSQVQAVKVVSNVGAGKEVVAEEQGEEPQPSKMISRPA